MSAAELSLAALFARTFVIGIAVAAPVGAMGMLIIQRTLEQGWRTGIATGLGIATADGTYAALAAFGVAAISATLVAWQIPLKLLGGAALVLLGSRAILSETPEGGLVAPASSTGSSYFSAVGLTLTNPSTIMAFGAVFASAGLVTQPGLAEAATATAGIFTGSLAWWFVLVTGVSAARVAAEKRLVQRVGIVSGALVIAFGLYAIGSAVLSLMG